MWSNKVSTLPPSLTPWKRGNDWGPQFHPLTFGDHLMDRIWIFLYDEISVEFVKMIFKFLTIDRGKLNIGKQNSTILRSGQFVR
jgi:hypothetical protein